MAEPAWFRVFQEPQLIVFLIPIVAIIAFALIVIVKLLIRHRERMAMIERGMHPDHPAEEISADSQLENPNFPH